MILYCQLASGLLNVVFGKLLALVHWRTEMNKICIAGIVVQIGNGWFVLKTDDIPGVNKSEMFVVKYHEHKYRVGEIRMRMPLCVLGKQVDNSTVINEEHITFLDCAYYGNR